MNRYAEQFNQLVLKNAEAACATFEELKRKTIEEKLMQINHHIPIFPRPGLIDQADLQAVSQDAERLLELLLSLPDRLFAGDVKKMCETLGFTAAHYELIKQTYGDNEGMMSRGDLFFDERGGYKFLEFNVDSSVGGIEIAVINRAMTSLDLYQEFNLAEEWKHYDPLDHLVETIKSLAAAKGITVQPITVAVIDWDTYINGYYCTLDIIEERFKQAGFDVIVCSQKEVALIDGKLMHQDKKIDLVYRVFLSDDALEHPEEIQPLLGAYHAGNLALLTGVHTELYSNKGNFALLSDSANRHLFTAEEAEVIDRSIAWTRFLADGVTEKDGQEIRLLDYVIQNKDQLVLKPTLGYGGHGVELGWMMSAEEWEKTVRELVASDTVYIVQERVYPSEEAMPMVVDGNLEFQQMILNWGLHVFNGKFAGALLRGLPAAGHGVINTAQGAGITCFFYK